MREHITARDLRAAVCGAAVMDADHVVVEGVPHHMKRVLQYVKAAGFNQRVPWCAAWVDYVVALITGTWKLPHPFEAVKHAALVQSYYDWAEGEGLVMDHPHKVSAGDLALFRFSGADRWNHIGIVTHLPRLDGSVFRFSTIEGNTSPGVGATGDERERDGGGVWRKDRTLGGAYPVAFVRLPTGGV